MTEAAVGWSEERSPTMGVVLLGILGLLLGLLGLCALLGHMGGEHLAKLAGHQQNEAIEMQRALDAEPLPRITKLVSVVVNTAFGIAFIVGSIGLFGLNRWAWNLCVSCVATFLIWSIMILVFVQVTQGARKAEILDASLNSEQFASMPEKDQRWVRFTATAGQWICMGCFGAAHALFLGGLLLPRIRKQFAPPHLEEPPPPVEAEG